MGYLTKEGVPYNESVTITVELWDQAEGGTSLWGPQEYAVAPEGGVFAIVLGASNAAELDTALLPASGWLSFTVEGSLLPQRQALQSVPYAVWAGNSQSCEEADSLGDWGCQDGQVIKWVEGTGAWTCANDLGGGGAQYTAGTGLVLAGTEFSVSQGVVEGWAQGVCYNMPQELADDLASWDQNASDDLTTGTVFGGDIGGTYGALELGSGVVEEINLATNSVTTGTIANATILFADFAQNDCLEGETMIWDGSAWTCDLVYTQAQVDTLIAGAIQEYQESQQPLSCGGVTCPDLGEGYSVTCNEKAHCEYANVDAVGWKQWDVWIYVAPGVFNMGEAQPTEVPVHSVVIAYGYLISKYEIVVAEYEVCKAGKVCTAPSTVDASENGWGTNSSTNHGASHPQNGLTWQQAKTFCAWIAPDGRLPSEAEWEYAAAGPAHLRYPWGNAPEPTCANGTAVFNEAETPAGSGCGSGGTWSVGLKPEGSSWSGAMDMSGNLWEWCEDWYQDDYDQDNDGVADAPSNGNAWSATGTCRVLRGGAFSYNWGNLRSAVRSCGAPTDRNANFGARCVRPLP